MALQLVSYCYHLSNRYNIHVWGGGGGGGAGLHERVCVCTCMFAGAMPSNFSKWQSLILLAWQPLKPLNWWVGLSVVMFSNLVGFLVLKELGVEVENYVASEIDPDAIKVSHYIMSCEPMQSRYHIISCHVSRCNQGIMSCEPMQSRYHVM